MLAALYGQLVPHSWRGPESEHAPHALFYRQSLAMGWLDDRSAGGEAQPTMRRAPGLWALNDAGFQHPRAPEGLLCWFQVEASAVADDRPLPVRPFLRCAVDVAARLGTLTLSTVRLLLPMQGVDAGARAAYAPVPSMLTAASFAESDPSTRTSVTISVDTEAGSPVDIAGQLAALDQDVFTVTGVSRPPPHDGPRPPIDELFWASSENGLTLRGDLVAWSSDAIGWVAEVVADLIGQHAPRAPLLFTATRT